MGKMKTGNLLPSTAGIMGQGNKGIGGTLGGILGGVQNSGETKTKQQQPQANPVGSILDQFKKKPQ